MQSTILNQVKMKNSVQIFTASSHLRWNSQNQLRGRLLKSFLILNLTNFARISTSNCNRTHWNRSFIPNTSLIQKFLRWSMTTKRSEVTSLTQILAFWVKIEQYTSHMRHESDKSTSTCLLKFTWLNDLKRWKNFVRVNCTWLNTLITSVLQTQSAMSTGR